MVNLKIKGASSKKFYEIESGEFFMFNDHVLLKLEDCFSTCNSYNLKQKKFFSMLMDSNVTPLDADISVKIKTS